jgi:putative ABC transport system permease protein
MDTLLQDLRYGIRSLFRHPSFALTAILTLALGIGATTAMFSVINGIVLRPLPFPDPARLVAVTNYWTRTGTRGTTVSAPDFHDWKAQSRSFDALGYYYGAEESVTVNGTADYALAYLISPGFFESLGATTSAGRLLSAVEQQPGGPVAVVITDAFWQKHFNRSAAAVGSNVKFGDTFLTIVGVLKPGLQYPARADLYGPSWMEPETTSRSAHNYRVVGRLRDDVSLAQARDEMLAIARRLETQHPNSNSGKLIEVVPLQELIVGDTRQTLYTLFGAVGLVLLIACANVANLLLARSTVREREMVVRAAVGAGRARLVRQLLTESAVLAVAGCATGIWLARLGIRALVALAPPDLPRLEEIQIDATVLAFALVVAVVASVIFGVAPAWHAASVQLVDGLRQGGKGSPAGARGGWTRSMFVVAEVALAVVLVFGATLLARSLLALASVQMGFVPEQLAVFRTVVPVRSFSEAPRATAFYRDLLAELRALPDVNAVGGVTSLPTIVRSNGGYWIEGGPGPEETGVRSPQALFTVATPDYFRAMRVPITSGRDFADGDRREAMPVAIINESLAKASFPGQDPLGRRIRCGLDKTSLGYMTIVGVVSDVRTSGPSRPAQPEIYMPYEQHPGPATALNLVMRAETTNPLALADTVSRKIRERNPDVPVKVSTMEATLDVAAATPRFRTFLLTVLAGLALLLALAGVYGVMAYTVNQRLPELGVRVALGATPRSIMRLVVGQGARLATAGIVIGLALALAAGRLLQGLLFGVTARDPTILATVAVTVAVATLAACWLPGRRAVNADPMLALRAE